MSEITQASHAHGEGPLPAGQELDPCPPEGCQGLPAPARSLSSLVASLALVATLMAVQIVGYFVTRSLVIALDALHMFTDLGAIGLALFAAWISRRPATSARTFGYFRAEILAALANGALLVGLTFVLVREAWERITDPARAPELEPRLMIVFGTIALAANVANALILHRGASAHEGHDDREEPGHEHHADLNVRGALLHVMGDVLGSIGAISAGTIIYWWHWTPADAVFAAFMSVIMLVSAILLCLRSVDVLLESAPRHVDLVAFGEALRRADSVREIHDLHVWTLTSGVYAMSCHATVAAGADHRRVLGELKAIIRARFRIDHTTIQLESEASAAVSS
ncbi:cation transporter [bacterium]|nr:cation transporter [bacterium]